MTHIASRSALLILFIRGLSSPKPNHCKSITTCSTMGSNKDEQKSIHSDHIGEEYDIPMDAILRPLPSQLDEEKVESLMKTLQDPNEQSAVPPIDVLWVKGSEGGNYYFSFGGCHRWEAHKRIQSPTIRAKLIKSTEKDLTTYLGASTPRLK